MNINQKIDHTLLRPDTNAAGIQKLCQEALEHDFFAVCVPPYFVNQAVQELQSSTVKVATVIAFPYGYTPTLAKVEEIRRGIDDGADEFDVVINLGALKSGHWTEFRSDLDRIVMAVNLRNKTSKIIIEITQLSLAELRQVCQICNDVEPTYVKTSTGLMGGATVDHMQFLRASLKPSIKLKASGGIRTKEDAEALISAGADRLGTSAGPKLIL